MIRPAERCRVGEAEEEVQSWRGGEVERWRAWRGGEVESGEVERWRGGAVKSVKERERA
jgi:hypothetical protein